MINGFELFDRALPREVPHFYLSLLGTRAEHRGRGYGLDLLAKNLRRIDEAGMPAYMICVVAARLFIDRLRQLR